MKQESDQIKIPRRLIDDFLDCTGISAPGSDSKNRYLWTDAFAVQCCFALAHILESEVYFGYALKLIDQVHSVLGRHRPDDERSGWISGLSENEGKLHPTSGGLRIGKKLPEKPPDEPFNQQLEWNRDGQYFHYLTRWFNALLQALAETKEKTYGLWAAELLEAGSKFVDENGGFYKMFWKMNIDLSEPVVKTMGAHDPLEGLVCTLSAMENVPETQPGLQPLKKQMKTLCRGMDWFSTDALGIGGLLLNTTRVSELKDNEIKLPASVRPAYLFAGATAGLNVYSTHLFDKQQPAESRLAFRECGLSLGIRVLHGMRKRYNNPDIDFESLEKYVPLAHEIESFWSDPENQQATSWQAHADINAIMLSASMLATEYPAAFCGVAAQ